MVSKSLIENISPIHVTVKESILFSFSLGLNIPIKNLNMPNGKSSIFLDINNLMSKIRNFICPIKDIQAIVLFGSFVSVEIEEKEDSFFGFFKTVCKNIKQIKEKPNDIDVLVLMKGNLSCRKKIDLSYKEIIGYDYGPLEVHRNIIGGLDIIAISMNDFQEELKSKSTIVSHIIDNGVELLGLFPEKLNSPIDIVWVDGEVKEPKFVIKE